MINMKRIPVQLYLFDEAYSYSLLHVTKKRIFFLQSFIVFLIHGLLLGHIYKWVILVPHHASTA